MSDHALTWKQLQQRGSDLARSLYGLGLRPGDRVGVMLYNLHQIWEISTALGLLGVGGVRVKRVR